MITDRKSTWFKLKFSKIIFKGFCPTCNEFLKFWEEKKIFTEINQSEF